MIQQHGKTVPRDNIVKELFHLLWQHVCVLSTFHYGKFVNIEFHVYCIGIWEFWHLI